MSSVADGSDTDDGVAVSSTGSLSWNSVGLEVDAVDVGIGVFVVSSVFVACGGGVVCGVAVCADIVCAVCADCFFNERSSVDDFFGADFDSAFGSDFDSVFCSPFSSGAGFGSSFDSDFGCDGAVFLRSSERPLGRSLGLSFDWIFGFSISTGGCDTTCSCG